MLQFKNMQDYEKELLEKILNSKFYKLWRAYCFVKDFIKDPNKTLKDINRSQIKAPIESDDNTFDISKYKFSIDWTHQAIGNFRANLLPLKNKINHGLEVGAFEGRATVWLAENLLARKKSTLTTVDIFETAKQPSGIDFDMKKIYKNYLYNIKASGKKRQITTKIGKSQEVLRSLPLNHYDYIYIDGSHRTDDTLEDAVLCHRLLKNGGFMIFDDYEGAPDKEIPETPRPAIDAFVNVFQEQYQVIAENYQLVLKKN
ncbi:MAG: class I SAM-dependent methyltransferase [Candidatus Woesebacteria bacterium]|jgi:predicted O-methyltransferase YrrM